MLCESFCKSVIEIECMGKSKRMAFKENNTPKAKATPTSIRIPSRTNLPKGLVVLMLFFNAIPV